MKTEKEWKELAENLRKSSRRSIEQREESWERSDTDGFVTQWACGLSSQLAERKAEICDNLGKAPFKTLYNLKGEKQNAKLINTRYGMAWAFCDKKGNFAGQFLNAFLKEENMRKKGYYVGEEMRWAWARFESKGHGLSGSCWVANFEVKNPETFDYSR